MHIFCFFWIPFFYLFRRTVSGEGTSRGIWALILGSIAAIFQFFGDGLIEPGGFGVSRWMSGFIDIVALPVLIPVIVCSILVLVRVFSGSEDFCGFTLLWLVPFAALRALGNSMQSPVFLVLVPLLWTALAVGIPFFINCIMGALRWQVIVPCAFCILALPVAAVSSYWAFFSHRMLHGTIFLVATALPMLFSLILDFLRAK